LGDLSTSIWS